MDACDKLCAQQHVRPRAIPTNRDNNGAEPPGLLVQDRDPIAEYELNHKGDEGR